MNGYGEKYGYGGKPRAAFYYPQVLLPADSSGIVNISSPSGSSDSGSSAGLPPTPLLPVDLPPSSPFKSPVPGIPGKNMHLMSKVQKGILQSHPKPLPSPSRNFSSQPVSEGVVGKQRPADLFINQFQAQMSQMKSAMDAVQHEIAHHKSGVPAPASSPLLSPVRRGRGRPPGSGKKNPSGASPISGSVAPSASPLATVPIYHSQISGSNGLIMKIKKSPSVGKRRGRKPGSGLQKSVKATRRKRRRNDEDDYGESEDEELGLSVAAKKGKEKSSRKKEESPRGGTERSEELADSSQWAQSIPPAILRKIFQYLVQTDGCIPSLVR